MKKKKLKLRKEIKEVLAWLIVVLVVFGFGFALANRVDEIENNKTNNNRNTSIKLVK